MDSAAVVARVQEMSSPRVPVTEGSLWTTPVPADTTPLAAAVKDPSATRERMRAAIAKANRRADELAGKVTDDLLRKTI